MKPRDHLACPLAPCPFTEDRLAPYFHVFSDADHELASDIAQRQDAASGARGTRGAGANLGFRHKGVLGEIAVARLLEIEPQVRALDGPDLLPDIFHPAGFAIEVKTGLPLEGKRKLNHNAIYLVGQLDIANTVWHLKAISSGAHIAEFATEPESWMTPRPGTRGLNWRIPDWSSGNPRLVI